MLLAIAKITTFDEVLELTCPETSCWVRQLEGPQEVADLLEVWSHGEDLVDDVLNADDAVLAEVFLNDGVVSKGNPLLIAVRGSGSVSNIGTCYWTAHIFPYPLL
jgi:hypothetical protein